MLIIIHVIPMVFLFFDSASRFPLYPLSTLVHHIPRIVKIARFHHSIGHNNLYAKTLLQNTTLQIRPNTHPKPAFLPPISNQFLSFPAKCAKFSLNISKSPYAPYYHPQPQ
jgi:hypothetical protein